MREKRAESREVREGVYAEGLFDFGGCGSKYRLCVDNAGVVDEDRGRAKLDMSVHVLMQVSSNLHLGQSWPRQLLLAVRRRRHTGSMTHPLLPPRPCPLSSDPRRQCSRSSSRMCPLTILPVHRRHL